MPSVALERHPDAPCVALRGIEASVTRNASGCLKVDYLLDGDIERIRIPPPRPARVDDAALAPGIALRIGQRKLALSASIAVPEDSTLLVALAAVIEDRSGALSYWALRHAPGKPDFHHPQGFALQIDEVRH